MENERQTQQSNFPILENILENKKNLSKNLSRIFRILSRSNCSAEKFVYFFPRARATDARTPRHLRTRTRRRTRQQHLREHPRTRGTLAIYRCTPVLDCCW